MPISPSSPCSRSSTVAFIRKCFVDGRLECRARRKSAMIRANGRLTCGNIRYAMLYNQLSESARTLLCESYTKRRRACYRCRLCEPMKIAILLTCILSCVAFAAGRPKIDSPYIYLSRTDTLYIQVTDNLTQSEIGRNDRFRRIKNTIEEVLEEVDFPLNYEIRRMSSFQPPPSQPRLNIVIWKWGYDGMSQIEARFHASIKREYDMNKLGVFSYRGGSPLGTNDQIIRVYNDVLREALKDLASDLNERLTVGLMEEEKDARAGLDEDDLPEDE